jgi:hypothetical protein
MENLAHSASLHSAVKSAPSKPGTKHLARGSLSNAHRSPHPLVSHGRNAAGVRFASSLGAAGASRSRRRARLLTAGLFAFVLGCVVAMNRGHFPVALGMGATNILMMLGYLLVLNAAAGLDG